MAINYDLPLRNLERESFHESSIDREFEAEVESAVSPCVPSGPLRNLPFAADPDLQAVALGHLRLGRPNESPYPAPIRSEGPAVVKVQQALIDLGCPLPHGDDGRYAEETSLALLSYKQHFNIRTVSGYLDGTVGAKTITHLDRNTPPPLEPAYCAGWESDPQSFSISAAEYYQRAVWQLGFSVASVTCTAPLPSWSCNVAAKAALSKLSVNSSYGGSRAS
jgi:peptidoglycan hydrolase-like protein with peptidoglycan-binding domain